MPNAGIWHPAAIIGRHPIWAVTRSLGWRKMGSEAGEGHRISAGQQNPLSLADGSVQTRRAGLFAPRQKRVTAGRDGLRHIGAISQKPVKIIAVD